MSCLYTDRLSNVLHCCLKKSYFLCHFIYLLTTSCRYITQEGAKLEVAKSKVPTTVTNAVSWRSEGIKYKKNEVFIDVIESINVLVRSFCKGAAFGCNKTVEKMLNFIGDLEPALAS